MNIDTTYKAILSTLLLAAAMGCGSTPPLAAPHGGGGDGGGGASTTGSGGDGELFPSGPSGSSSSGSAQGSCDTKLAGVVRDFRAYDNGAGHPDFETFMGAGMKGIVQTTLGQDHKPVYALPGPSAMTSGKDAFDQWYRDVPGVNAPIPFSLTPVVDGSGLATYDSSAFFPIDGQGFGDEGWPHNYHFTYELHMTFVYKGGEVFSFTGDDDLWVFVNDRLAIDLGGLHEPQSDTLDLDARAADLGIEVGKEYPLDFFQAERHTTGSTFKIQSTLSFTNCDPIVY